MTTRRQSPPIRATHRVMVSPPIPPIPPAATNLRTVAILPAMANLLVSRSLIVTSFLPRTSDRRANHRAFQIRRWSDRDELVRGVTAFDFRRHVTTICVRRTTDKG